MTLHKNTRLLPRQKVEIFNKYHRERRQVTSLAAEYQVSRVTIYKVLREVRLGQTHQQPSTNVRFRTVGYGLKRLAKVEKLIENKRKAQAKRYNKKYPGEMIHVDCCRLPLLEGENKQDQREYLFVGIDDYSRELYAGIFPDKTSSSASQFLKQILDECPYTIECIYSDNGREFKGNPHHHPFMQVCMDEKIIQRYTRVKRPQTNGKAERVIRTLKENWHASNHFTNREERKLTLNRFINYYNLVKPHASLNKQTPMEILINYFYQSVNNA
jgi:transposase InsO family protein